MTHHKTHLHHTIPAVLILLTIAIGVFIIAALFPEENAPPAGVLICTAAGCTMSVHEHVDVSLMVCGERVTLPSETGTLDGPHTHRKQNQIHLHAGLPYDAETGAFKETSLRSLGRLFDVLQMPFTQNCIGTHCNGEMCNGHPGVLSMTVNGMPNAEFRAYRWSDKDHVVIRFQ